MEKIKGARCDETGDECGKGPETGELGNVGGAGGREYGPAVRLDRRELGEEPLSFAVDAKRRRLGPIRRRDDSCRKDRPGLVQVRPVIGSLRRDPLCGLP